MKIFYILKSTFLILLLFIFNLHLVLAQSTEIIATNVPGVNGMNLDRFGNLWITQPGIPGIGGTVSVITPDLAINIAIVGLPVFFDSVENESQGAWKAYHNGNTLQVIVGGREHPGTGSLITFDISNWKPGDNPLTFADAKEITNIASFINSQGIIESDPYRAVWDEHGNAIIADAAANAIVRKDARTGQLSILHSFPPIPNTFTPFPPFIDYVPTGIVKNAAGGYYISNLTGFPFVDGLAKIVKMDDNGNVTPFVDSLSIISDLDIDDQGNLYALQLGQFDSIYNPIPFAAKVTKITSDGKSINYLSDFTPVLSSGIAVDGNGGCYVNDFALGIVYHLHFPTATENQTNSYQLKLKVSPNPISVLAKLEFTLENGSKTQLLIYNENGKLVQTQNLGILSAGIHYSNIDMREMPSGTYLIQLNTSYGNGIQKLWKQ